MEARQRENLEKIKNRRDELANILGSEEVIKSPELLKKYNKEAAGIRELADLFAEYEKIEEEITASKELANESDGEIKELAQTEIEDLQDALAKKEEVIVDLLLGEETGDKRNVYLEIRAGAGGDEAAIFGGDLLSMYQRYTEKRGWNCEIIDISHSDQGGYKQAVIYVKGDSVYGDLKFESGTHRVQRVPKTEAKGRLHTSTCTVAVIPEVENTDEIEIKKSDIRVDTFRASGAGGQHVNKTDSAIRLTHIPSGIVAECQEDRSQHRNKEKALSVLKAKLLQDKLDKEAQETAQLRKSLVGRGDRAEKIRTYNFPQNRVTDHRLGLSLHSLDGVILGDLDTFIEALKTEEKSRMVSQSSG